MKKFKPSELPVYTIIEDLDDGGLYMKDVAGGGRTFWDPYGSCWDCRGDYSVLDTQADEMFKNFRIWSLPFAVTEYLLANMGELDGGDEMLEEAIKNEVYISDHPKRD